MTARLIEKLKIAEAYPSAPGVPAVCREARAEIERLRGLLGRYAMHVIDSEGVSFLSGGDDRAIDQHEAEEIRGYLEAADGYWPSDCAARTLPADRWGGEIGCAVDGCCGVYGPCLGMKIVKRKMQRGVVLRDAENETLEEPPIHRWFGLSFCAYFVMPRLAMQELPHDWQKRFIGLMDEAEAVLKTTPSYVVLRDEPRFTVFERDDPEDETSTVRSYHVFDDDPWANYRRGSVKSAQAQDQANDNR